MRKKQGPIKHIVQEEEGGLQEPEAANDLSETPEFGVYTNDAEMASPVPHYSETSFPVDIAQADKVSKDDNGEDDDLQEVVSYKIDVHGVGKLPDGTVVVEPKPVDDSSDSHEWNEVRRGRTPNNPTPTANTAAISTRGRLRGSTGEAASTAILPGRPANASFDLVKCTRCSEKFDPFHSYVGVHPSLLVLMCKRCIQLYKTSQELERDPSDNKDCQCRWCIGYGDLFCCDVCSNSFCRRCIKRNLGRSALSHVQNLGENDTWLCYVCDPQPLSELRDECSRVLQEVLSFKEAQRRRLDRRFMTENSQGSSGATSSKQVNTSNGKVNDNDIVYIGDSDSDSEDAAPAQENGSRKLPLTNALLSQNNRTNTNEQIPNLALLLQQLQTILPLQNVPLNNVVNMSDTAGGIAPPAQKVRILQNSSDASRIAYPAGAGGTMNGSTPPGAAAPESLREASLISWLRDTRQLNQQNIGSVLQTALRVVAGFYQELRRLQLSIQRENVTLRERVECVKSFRGIYENYFYNRLARLLTTTAPTTQRNSTSQLPGPPASALNMAGRRVSLPVRSLPASSGMVTSVTNVNSSLMANQNRGVSSYTTPLSTAMRTSAPVAGLRSPLPQQASTESGLAARRMPLPATTSSSPSANATRRLRGRTQPIKASDMTVAKEFVVRSSESMNSGGPMTIDLTDDDVQ